MCVIVRVIVRVIVCMWLCESLYCAQLLFVGECIDVVRCCVALL